MPAHRAYLRELAEQEFKAKRERDELRSAAKHGKTNVQAPTPAPVVVEPDAMVCEKDDIEFLTEVVFSPEETIVEEETQITVEEVVDDKVEVPVVEEVPVEVQTTEEVKIGPEVEQSPVKKQKRGRKNANVIE